ncbi:MAG: M50 family metallopeptidase [Candidatus Lokiarchaeota archaeon]|nr:M50 family metallopeptidase [Candidatus Lokiarchaeota archaeon]
MISSSILSSVVFSLKMPDRLRTVLMAFFFVGVFIHEISHAIAAFLVGLKVNHFEVKWRSARTGNISPHGSVGTDVRRSFLQQLVVSIAPLLVSTWLFFLFLDLALKAQFADVINLLAGFACVSVLFSASPSYQDFVLIGRYFKKDVMYSLYQIGLISASLTIVLVLSWAYSPSFFNILYYILVGVFYYILKYSIKGVSALLQSKRSNWKQWQDLSILNRKTHKAIKARQLGVKEAHW